MIYHFAEDVIEIFDSLGCSETFIRQHFHRKMHYEFNITNVQCHNSIFCGGFAIYFSILRYFPLVLDFGDVVNEIFSENCSQNEEVVKDFLQIL